MPTMFFFPTGDAAFYAFTADECGIEACTAKYGGWCFTGIIAVKAFLFEFIRVEDDSAVSHVVYRRQGSKISDFFVVERSSAESYGTGRHHSSL